MKYRNPIITRTPFTERTPIIRRVPSIERIPIVGKKFITSKELNFEGCVLFNEGCGCNNVNYCSVYTTREDNQLDFRVIRVLNEEHSVDYWNEVIKSIEFVKSQGCNIRMITDSEVPREVLFVLSYSPYNVVQYNFNLFDESILNIRDSLMTSVNCGLYVTLMLYPVVPGVTKTYDIIELISSLQYSCRTICFKFLELPENYEEFCGFYNVNGNLVPSEYMEYKDDKIVCNENFKESFCTIMTMYMDSRKINCSLCNDKICY